MNELKKALQDEVAELNRQYERDLLNLSSVVSDNFQEIEELIAACKRTNKPFWETISKIFMKHYGKNVEPETLRKTYSRIQKKIEDKKGL